MWLGDIKHERPCFEQREIAFLIGRNLTERMKRQMRGFSLSSLALLHMQVVEQSASCPQL